MSLETVHGIGPGVDDEVVYGSIQAILEAGDREDMLAVLHSLVEDMDKAQESSYAKVLAMISLLSDVARGNR